MIFVYTFAGEILGHSQNMSTSLLWSPLELLCPSEWQWISCVYFTIRSNGKREQIIMTGLLFTQLAYIHTWHMLQSNSLSSHPLPHKSSWCHHKLSENENLKHYILWYCLNNNHSSTFSYVCDMIVSACQYSEGLILSRQMKFFSWRSAGKSFIQ